MPSCMRVLRRYTPVMRRACITRAACPQGSVDESGDLRRTLTRRPRAAPHHADFAQHYVKGKVIGSGSFGVVHLGIDLHTGQEVRSCVAVWQQ